jgi:hypothetical protein
MPGVFTKTSSHEGIAPNRHEKTVSSIAFKARPVEWIRINRFLRAPGTGETDWIQRALLGQGPVQDFEVLAKNDENDGDDHRGDHEPDHKPGRSCQLLESQLRFLAIDDRHAF